jgi:hypothetical protein
MDLVEKMLSLVEYVVEVTKGPNIVSLNKLKTTIDENWKLFEEAHELIHRFLQSKFTFTNAYRGLSI